ncbi:uncharacterized protein LOC122543966 isoform X3 [Chiloscyllium plagiosum]|uniref:uncharacterized protein LOC122543966 isoform X3 n=1 Tax=Chiloscyllium plagiosum TaxID=36176 RepID=UPI001CB7B560|nr:uncharacterized protein LOC122543966 isoform X3 [Chiloscyllium plagiosum]
MRTVKGGCENARYVRKEILRRRVVFLRLFNNLRTESKARDRAARPEVSKILCTSLEDFHPIVIRTWVLVDSIEVHSDAIQSKCWLPEEFCLILVRESFHCVTSVNVPESIRVNLPELSDDRKLK